jgi:hypothetical protein
MDLQQTHTSIAWSLSSQSVSPSAGSTENTSRGGVMSTWTRKTQLPLLLHVGPCLQSCCLAMRWSNPLQYFPVFSYSLWQYFFLYSSNQNTSLFKWALITVKPSTDLATCLGRSASLALLLLLLPLLVTLLLWYSRSEVAAVQGT